MQKILLIISTFYGMSGVILGAFGAHALRARLSVDKLASFETGVKYQFIHALAIIAACYLFDKYRSDLSLYAGVLFVSGVFLFSGSIYLLSTNNLLNIENWKFLGPITPIGGLLLIAGWVLLFVSLLNAPK